MSNQSLQPISLFTEISTSLVDMSHLTPMPLKISSGLTSYPQRIKYKSEAPANSPLPFILYARQFMSQPSQVYSFQCDCACPDDGFSLSAPQPFAMQNAPLHHPFLHTQSLTDEYRLMFNPYSDQGIAVLNPAAQQLWQHFQQPRHLHDVVQAYPERDITVDIQNLCQLGLLQPVGYLPQPRKAAPKVLNTWIHVTNECNLRCDYCYINKTDDDMPADVGRATVDAILRSAIQHGFRHVKLKFAGGEATLNLKRVFDIHTYATDQAHEKGLHLDTVVLSNGVSIGERAIEEFERRGIRVSISLDGVGADHDAQRQFKNGKGSFAWVNRTLDRLLARGIKPFISITLSNRNADGLADVIQYVVDRDLPFNINFFRDNECATSHRDLKLMDDKIIEAMQQAFAVLEANLPERSLLGSLVDRAQFNAPHDKTCSVGDSYLVIDHKGNIAKCQMEIERPITSIYADDPLAFIRSDRLGIQNISVEEKEGCRSCEWKYWCTGGCAALTYRATGRYDVKSPNCRIYKALYPEMLRLEGLRLLKLASKQLVA